MTARAQAQNAADAGALAGAVALVFNNYNEPDADRPAVQSAINAAQANKVIGGRRSDRAGRRDVSARSDRTATNRVQVEVYRTAARGNAVPTLIGPFFGVNDGRHHAPPRRPRRRRPTR